MSTPETYYKADREAAKVGLSPLQLAYVEKLEDALKAAGEYEEMMRGRVHSPEQHKLSSDLLVKMSKVNFLEEQDHIALEEELSCETFLALSDAIENELPRDVIFQ